MKFSESPFFLLNDFFYESKNKIQLRKPIIQVNWIVPFVSIFSNGSTNVDVFIDSYKTFSNYTLFGEKADSNFSILYPEKPPNSIIFTNWDTNKWSFNHFYDPNQRVTKDSYMIGPIGTIIAKGGGVIDAYIKDDEKGFVPVPIKYKESRDNTFLFERSGRGADIPGDTIVEEISSESFPHYIPENQIAYKFTRWNYTKTDPFENIVNAAECYLRKDGVYHEWLNKRATEYYQEKWGIFLDIRKYVNTDQIFSFLSYIYRADNSDMARVIYHGMKDYVMKAIPEHQRTDNFTDYHTVLFDRHYNEIYTRLKDIWKLIDPMEVDYRYLGYLSKYYDMFDVNELTTTQLHIREFVRDMIYFIRRKGTYSAYFILWKILTTTSNRLNIYERWHPKGIINRENTVVQKEDWDDYLYIYKDEYAGVAQDVEGGSGPVYYARSYPTDIDNYPVSDKVLSTHFIIETDLSDEPLLQYEIMTEDLWYLLHKYWQYIKPVSKVSEYRIVIAPKTNFTGRSVPLYTEYWKSSAFMNTKALILDSFEDGVFIYRSLDISNSWSFMHNLNKKDFLIQCLDEEMNELVPREIIFNTFNHVTVVFGQPVSGYVMCRVPEHTETRFGGITNLWTIYHDLQDKSVVVQYHLDSQKIYEGNTELFGNDFNGLNDSHIEGDFSYPIADKFKAPVSRGFIHIQETPTNIWNIGHNLNKKFIITNVYTADNIRIHPSQFTIIDSNNMVLQFNNPVNGYAVLVPVSDISYGNAAVNFMNNMTAPYWKVYENIGDFENGIAELESGPIDAIYESIDEQDLYIDVKIPYKSEYIIKEIVIFNDRDEAVFYTENSELFKPKNVFMTIHHRIRKIY